MAGPNLLVKKRMLVVLMFFSIILIALLVRVAWIQIVRGDWYQKKAFEQQTQSRVISPRRGTIYDRNGKELAISASVETITVNPLYIRRYNKNIEMIAQRLSEILNLSMEEVLKKLKRRYLVFRCLLRI